MFPPSSTFIGGIQHGDDVLGRDVGLNVVDLSKDISPARFEYAESLSHMFADLLRSCSWKNMLGVAPAAPENDLATELFL